MTTWHYALSAIIIAPLVIFAWRALRRSVEIFAPPLLVCFGIVFLYVLVYPLIPANMIQYFLEPDAYLLLLLVSALSMYAFIGGYSLAYKGRVQGDIPSAINPQISFGYCMFVLIIAFVSKAYFISLSGGPSAFYSAIHGTAGAWLETSGYIYRLQEFLWPTAYLLFARRLLGCSRGIVERLALVATIALLAFETFVFGNRGDTIRFVMIYGISLVLFRQRPPSSAKLFVVICAAIFAVLLFPFLRDATFLGAERDFRIALSESLESSVEAITEDEANIRFYPQTRHGRPITGSGFFIAAAVIKGAYVTGRFDLGFGWLAPFMGLAPRFLWPTKHQVLGRWFSNPKVLIDETTHWSAATGSSLTGVADAYVRFSWFAPFVWFLFGVWGGRVWKKARNVRSPLSVGYFVAYLIGLNYLVTQSFGAALYAWIFFSVPLWGATILFSRRRQPTRLPNRQMLGSSQANGPELPKRSVGSTRRPK